MYCEFVLPAFFCVAGLIMLAGVIPIDVQFAPEADEESEDVEVIDAEVRPAEFACESQL